ncbi:MAG: nitroreductase family protein [Duncaniella sp.]|uniref:nitroreductase family protein n=1 Tax=Duncaniella sp. TaxID=2518496 RepID=UPI0023C3BF57|nr:nitroreductase family protein [Duncaniella sp.]MDE6090941.1 nitroreductase family protein [Duncaniella sp.]
MNTTDYFSTRRTIRKYDQSREIDPAMIDRMLEEAARAANTGNMQTYSVIVTTEPEEIAKLAPAHFNQPAITGAKAVLTFCIDFNRFNRWCRINHADPGLNNLQGFTWGVIDTSLFAQQFVTIAEMNGLGTCYLGTTTYNAEPIAETLHLPSDVVPVITVTVGYPAETPELTERLPVGAIVHHGHYHNPIDEELVGIYAEKDGLESSKQFVKDNGKDNLAQVFAEVRYPRSANEQFSRVYKEFLKNQGIAL